MSESIAPPPAAAIAEHDAPTDTAIASTSEPVSQTVPDANSATNSTSFDSQSFSKQKRKRTSARDQQILEAEFKRNPRPDKAERLDLVSRVGLTDKEVQVWFQNRRQSSRRRSRPSDGTELMLLPSSQGDIDALHALSGADVQSLPNQSFFDLTFDADIPSSSAPAMLVSTPAAVKSEAPEDPTTISLSDSRPSHQRTKSFEDSPLTKFLQAHAVATPSKPPSFTKTPSLPKAGSFTSGETGYVADRRSAAARSISNGFALPPATPVAPAAQPAPSPATATSSETRSLKRSRSYLRITMDDEGHAELIDRAVKSPSPKKTADLEARSSNLRRSHSAVGGDQSEISELFSKKAPRTTAMGRSRDSRAWEFWCDSDARNSLASKADQEINGSAVDAIGQIVASNKALRAHSRRSMHMSGNRLSGGFQKSNRTPLSRSRTSNGRLQSMGFATPKLKDINTKGKGVEEHLITDSDKENWTPTTEGTPFDSRRNSYFNAPSGAVDRQSPLRKGEFSRPGTAETLDENAVNSRSKDGTPDGEDPEISHFMRGGGNSRASSHSATSSGEDLECVQSLLTLSQGNWR